MADVEYKRLSECDITVPNTKIYVVSLVKKVEMKSFKNGAGEYMRIVLADRKVEISANIWEVSNNVKEKVKAGNVYFIGLEIKPYEKSSTGVSYIVVDMCECNVSPREFIAVDEHSKSSEESIKAVMEFIGDTVYGEIANKIIQKHWNEYISWVGGKSMHHVQIGSLIFHVASVAGVALAIAKRYNMIYGESFLDCKLVLAGSILHDIGKIKELDVDMSSGTVEYSSQSVLMGHLLTGVLEIENVANELGYAGKEEVKLLQHMVASHHGTLEMGALIEPSIPEAYILHMADMLDAKMWFFKDRLDKMANGEGKSEWIAGTRQGVYKKNVEIKI